MIAATETAFAKINLALHVRRRAPDGYHDLETVFAFAEDGDLLTVAPDDGLSLTVTGPFAALLDAADDNLVLRAARALRGRHGVTAGARLTLDKRLPVAAGIGGGSADAAATLRLLARVWDLPADPAGLLAIAGGLGADVPACVASITARGEGRGDRLQPMPDAAAAGTPLLLVNPGIALATGPVFAGWDRIDRGALPQGDVRAGRNDLEAPARALVPGIGTVLDRLAAAPGTTLVRMSGSGATCFALFDSLATRDAAAAGIAGERPDWWLLATRLR